MAIDARRKEAIGGARRRAVARPRPSSTTGRRIARRRRAESFRDDRRMAPSRAADSAPWAPAPVDSRPSRPQSAALTAADCRSINRVRRASQPSRRRGEARLARVRVSRRAPKCRATAAAVRRSLAFAAVDAVRRAVRRARVDDVRAARHARAVAVGPNSPLELVSLSHARQNDKLAVSGLVRNPGGGQAGRDSCRRSCSCSIAWARS